MNVREECIWWVRRIFVAVVAAAEVDTVVPVLRFVVAGITLPVRTFPATDERGWGEV